MAIKQSLFPFLLILTFSTFSPFQAIAQDKENASSTEGLGKLTLVQAAICEGIKELSPENEAIVFSIKRGRVYCFTLFDPVPEKAFIYHNWFFRDQPRRRVRLTLQTPRWSTFSRIGFREDDMGPWRVEISDDEGNIFQILRFSITE